MGSVFFCRSEWRARALAASAQMLGPIADFELGGRTFCCRDPEGHVWLFTSHDPWKKIW